MTEERLCGLAVARLDELTPALRQRPDAPMRGFCLVSLNRQHCRVSIYVENGTGLGGEAGGETRHYEGWLVGPAGVVSLGVFDLGPDGQGCATQVIDASAVQAGRAEKVRVTVETHGEEAHFAAVLEGRLIWLETEAAEVRSEPAGAEPAEGAAEEAREPAAVAARAAPAEAPPAEAVTGAGEAAPTPSQAPRQTRPSELTITLEQRHPMAPRAGGTATINLKQGSLSLALRGLPSPTALGRDRTTDRPYNVYRVWLLNRQTHQRVPVGFCERAWGDNFRFRAEGLPLNRHDTILVTVEDRTAPGPNYGAPHVLVGSYVE